MSEAASRNQATIGRLTGAEDLLERELRRTIDEREALQRFRNRVRKLDPDSTIPSGTRLRQVSSFDQRETAGLRSVREAYQSSVMAVPHYTEEYDDTYAESIRDEFGPEIAAALVSRGRIDDLTRHALLAAITDSVSRRRTLEEAIEKEIDSLRAVRSEIESVANEVEEIRAVRFDNCNFGILDAYRARLDALESKCEVIIERRQEAIFEQRRTGWLPPDVPDIAMYFYQELEVDYPVLDCVGNLLTIIGGTRARVEREMSYCE